MQKHSKHYYEKDRNQEAIREIKFFKLSEFDSPDSPGSGQNMDLDFVRKLDICREIAGVSFKINSGYRTKQYNEDLKKRGYKASNNSAHLKGLAADISTPNSEIRYKILSAIIRCNFFNRIGIGNSFIHVDTDNTKTPEVCWHYY
tara:strand:+ start:1330 stop:1764 length:435 start_codon:yes stop_codon:yes gene_type:complete